MKDLAGSMKVEGLELEGELRSWVFAVSQESLCSEERLLSPLGLVKAECCYHRHRLLVWGGHVYLMKQQCVVG